MDKTGFCWNSTDSLTSFGVMNVMSCGLKAIWLDIGNAGCVYLMYVLVT